MRNKYTAQKGLTLIELMISMTLGLMLVAVTAGVLLSSNRNFMQDDSYSRMQENGRFALRHLTHELTMANYWGGMINPGTSGISNNLTVTTDCGITYNDANASLILINNATAATASATFSCIPNSTAFHDGTDVLMVKRLSTPVSAQTHNYPYVITDRNSKAGRLVKYDSGSADATLVPNTAMGEEAYEFRPRIYYIRVKDTSGADITPTLYVKQFDNSGTMTLTDAPLIEGIENIQFEFGMDTNRDGVPDFYATAPAAADMKKAVTVRIYVLARSIDEVPSYTNTKVYNLGATQVDPNPDDAYYRRVYSNTVVLRNTAYLARLD